MPPVFEKVPTELDFPKEEREVLAFWSERRIFERSLEQRKGAPTFVFYEGPPTANGLPHNGHVLTRVIKDLFPRYKTMRGYRVPRKAGWDTHGLPVEVEVEKELHIHGKAAIEAYGIEPFVARCIQSVFRYTSEWEHLTRRVGFWVDLNQAYVTYHKSYVESVWWALSELFKKGLLYQGHKVVWWWAQGGTALSSAEVGLGYRPVDDPSVFVAFPLVAQPDVSLLVWTTTPWTLPSNMYAAVHPDFDYAFVRTEQGRRYIVAKDLAEPLAQKLKTTLTVERTVKGRELVNLEYRPPFELYTSQQKKVRTKEGEEIPAYWRVIAADFVLLDASGIVHVAPAFGEDDHHAFRKEQARLGDPSALDLFCAVKSDGTFIPELTRYAGRWVKDCDKDIQRELRDRGLLVHAETYRHDYPFCWRADSDPLIQFARPAWYIRTTARIQDAITNNRAVQWLPEHIKEGRMGDFLANNVDWALSRERYWGTPLNIWVCDRNPEHREAPASVAEILAKNPKAFDHFHAAKKRDPSLNEHLIVHKPWIDQVTFPCDCGGTKRRVPDVIDCWFDSGCMPFAQWGFPHKGQDEFRASFPADFISEAIDQTRGWFYSLLMISTLVFDEECQKRLGLAPVRPYPHPYKTCIVLGHITDKEGKKESKSKGNYTPPDVILDKVAMEFAVLDPKDVQGLAPKAGVAFIAREDLEGLDLQDGAKVRLYRAGHDTESRELTLQVGKQLRRRVVVLDPADREALGLVPVANPEIKPVDVPQLAPTQRVVIEDPFTPAPGADAFRWFFYASNPPWNATRHSLSNVRALQKEFAIKLRNVYSFFTIYANIDGYDPAKAGRAEATELDRWLRSELELTVDGVTRDMDAYDVYAATQKLTAFVDALSNWYVRRSRDRFWRAGWDPDKQSAYDTLFHALLTVATLTAPFTPFAAEGMYRNLTAPLARAGRAVPESVHLATWPSADLSKVDCALSRRMREVRELVSLGLQVRTQHKLKVRQPLRAAHIVLADASMGAELAGAEEMIKEELNVLGLELVPQDQAERFVRYSYKPNFRSLGQKGLGKEAQQLKKAWASLDAEGAATLGRIVREGEGTFDGVALTREDIDVTFETKPGFAAAGDRVGVVVLETTLDDELRALGYLRELQNRVQTMRKEMGLEYTDRIRLWTEGGERLRHVVERYGESLAKECLAVSVSIGKPEKADADREVEVEGEKVRLAVARATT